MKNSGWMTLLAVVSALVGPPGTRGESPGGIGVLGDSYSDEYQFYPPDRSSARNWVEILAESRGLDFGPFSEASRGEPRNQGFAYNWARSDAETGDLIASGQHTGLAAQVSRGEVSLVVVFAGGNDFIHALQARDPAAALEGVLPRALGNYRLAVATIHDASPRVRLLLATVPDILDLPEFAGPLRSGRMPSSLAQALRTGVRTFNEQIRGLAASSERVRLLDLEQAARMAVPLGTDRVIVAGRVLDRSHPGNSPGHLFLADARHLGTLGQALMAKLIVDALDSRFQAGIPPLALREVLKLADAPTLHHEGTANLTLVSRGVTTEGFGPAGRGRE